MWPFGEAQIQTSRHAGGMASARMRESVAASRTGLPLGVDIAEPLGRAEAAQAGRVVADPTQTGVDGGPHRVEIEVSSDGDHG